MHFSTRPIFFALALLAPLAACSDEKGATTEGTGTDTGTTSGTSTTGDDTSTSTPTTTGDTPTTSGTTEVVEQTSTTTTTDPTTTDGPVDTSTSSGTTVVEPETSTTLMETDSGDPLEQCLANFEPGDPCGQCICTDCGDQAQACQADPGCTAIFMCAQEQGCSGFDCLAVCGDVINDNGGVGGMSAMNAIGFGNCVNNSCAADCGG